MTEFGPAAQSEYSGGDWLANRRAFRQTATVVRVMLNLYGSFAERRMVNTAKQDRSERVCLFHDWTATFS